VSSKLCPFCMRMTESETCPHCGKNVNYAGSTAHLPAGYVVSGKHPYVLGAALGQGGFGITYIALDMVTGERVAIKEYYPTYCSVRSNASTVDPYANQEEVYFKGKERFLDEARTLKSLSDLKSIVNVLDFFEANNTAYLVMEFLDGQSLKEHAAKNGKFPAGQFLDQIRPLMEDIHRMHERGVIHRDIAPDNIVLQPDGQMKLIDFGAARSFVGDKSMTVVVKKGFAPVEQYMSKGSSAATDVYALAATIYYCITGRVPPDSAARQYDNAPLEAPSVHGADLAPQQEKALLKALEIQQKDRTQSVQAFLDNLRVRKPVQQKTVQQKTVQQKPAKEKPEKRDSNKQDNKGNRKSSSKKWIPVTVASAVLAVFILVSFYVHSISIVSPDSVQDNVQMTEPQIAYEETNPSHTVEILGQEYDKNVTELDLSTMTSADVEEVAEKLTMLPNVISVYLTREDGTSILTKEDVLILKEALPDAVFHYVFNFYGETISTTDQEVHIRQKQIGDEGIDELRSALSLMHSCDLFLVENCQISYDLLAKVREEFRDKTKLVWRVEFGGGSCLTDVEVIRCTNDLLDNNCQNLIYCEDVRFMDIGHNEWLDAVPFVAGMPNLEGIIISGAPFKDLTPFQNCKKLKFLEIAFCEYIEDLTPLAGCESLQMLNISNSWALDLSPLDKLPLTHFVERLNPSGISRVPKEEQERFIQQHPDCWTSFSGAQPYGVGWRYEEDGSTPLTYYTMLREVFGYDAATIPNNEGWYLPEDSVSVISDIPVPMPPEAGIQQIG